MQKSVKWLNAIFENTKEEVKAMKKIWVSILLLVVVGLLVGFNAANAGDMSATISTKAWSKYINNNASVSSEKSCWQTNLFVELPAIATLKGFYVDIWHSTGLDDFPRLSSNWADEGVYMVGCGGVTRGLGFDMGILYDDALELFHSNGDVFSPYGEISKSFQIFKNSALSPFVRLEFYFPVRGSEPKKGIYSYAGLKHSWQLSPRLSISQKGAFMHDNGAFGRESSLVGQYDGEVSYKILKFLSIEPLAAKVRIPITSVSDGRKTETAFAAGITLHF
jgi:hypothetical protein